MLHGLPVAHKDLVDTAGIRTTRGSPFYRDNVPTRDALIVTRIRAAGAITCGKTNTPEFGAGSQTFNSVFGATRNPYDLDQDLRRQQRRRGGGAGVRHGADRRRQRHGRLAAQSRGVLQRRRLPPVAGPRAERIAARWSPLSVSGPMARSVADVALFLSAIAGPDPRSPLSIAEDGAPLPRAARARLQGRARRVVARARRHSVRAGDPPRRRREPPRLREPRLHRRGGRARLRRRGRGVSGAAVRRQSPAVRAARPRAARVGEGHDQVRGRARPSA